MTYRYISIHQGHITHFGFYLYGKLQKQQMMFKLVQFGFRVSDNVMDFTVVDHLKLILFWVVGITVIHGVLFVVRNCVKLMANPMWWLISRIVETIGLVYFNIVGTIGCLYYAICMLPLLIVSSGLSGVVIPTCNVVSSICERLDIALGGLMQYTGLIPTAICDSVYKWIVLPNLPVEKSSGNNGAAM
jgi:predicted membrane protein